MGGLSDQFPDLISLKSWAKFSQMLKGNLHLALLEGPLILFEYEDVVQAETMLHIGVKWFKGKCLLLDWWNPSVSYLIEDRKSRDVWVRILGLPLHL